MTGAIRPEKPEERASGEAKLERVQRVRLRQSLRLRVVAEWRSAKSVSWPTFA